MTYVSGYASSSITFGASAYGSVLTAVSSASAVSSTKIRVYFDKGMLVNSALTSKYNYILTTTDSDSVVPYISSVEYENTEYPEYVDLITSEATNNTTYTVEVNPDGPVDKNSEPIDPDNNSYDFSGIGVNPYIKSVVAVGKNRVDVIFSEQIIDNAPVRDETQYVFDGGLSVVSVLDVEGDTVKLVTSDQTEGTVYNLTINAIQIISPVITGVSGTDIVSTENDVIITGIDFTDSGTVEICDNADYSLATIKITQSSVDSYTNTSIQVDIDASGLFS